MCDRLILIPDFFLNPFFSKISSASEDIPTTRQLFGLIEKSVESNFILFGSGERILLMI